MAAVCGVQGGVLSCCSTPALPQTHPEDSCCARVCRQAAEGVQRQNDVTGGATLCTDSTSVACMCSVLHVTVAPSTGMCKMVGLNDIEAIDRTCMCRIVPETVSLSSHNGHSSIFFMFCVGMEVHR